MHNLLTSTQRMVINRARHIDRIKVYGPPGTGKTFTLIALYSSLLESSSIDRIPAIAFNRSVADEIASRTARTLNLSSTELKREWVSTFHAFCRRLLIRKAGMAIKVLDENEIAKKYLEYIDKEGEKELKIAKKVIEIYFTLEERKGIVDPYEIYEIILADLQIHIKRGKLPYDADDVRKFLFPSFIPTFQSFREHRFSSPIKEVSFYELLLLVDREFQVIDFFDAVLIDEVQDLSPTQWRIVKKFRGKIYLFGDDDQSIYGYRGARPKEFLDFPAEPIVLDITFRYNSSYARMLEEGLRLFIKERQRKIVSGEGPSIFISFVKSFEEFIKEAYEEEKPALILSRTNKKIEELSEELRKGENIGFMVPHRIQIHEEYDAENIVFKNIQKAYIFITSQTEEELAEKLSPFIRRYDYSNLPVREKINILRRHYPDYLLIFEVLKNKTLEQKIRILIDARDKTLKKHARIIYDNADLKNLDKWFRLMKEPKILLSTIHRIKGGECENVFIRGFKDGLMPLRRAGSQIDFEEEARIAYVALSRTKRTVYVDSLETPFIGFLLK